MAQLRLVLRALARRGIVLRHLHDPFFRLGQRDASKQRWPFCVCAPPAKRGDLLRLWRRELLLDRAPLVAVLLLPRRPSAVAGLIMAFLVDAAEYVLGRRLAPR